jgi:hypothetical protein
VKKFQTYKNSFMLHFVAVFFLFTKANFCLLASPLSSCCTLIFFAVCARSDQSILMLKQKIIISSMDV